VLYVFYGPDTFSRAEALAELRARLDSDGMLGVNTTVLDGRQIEPRDLFAHCDATPFLSACRLVIVEGLLGGAPRRARQQGRGAAGDDATDWAAALPAYVARMPDTTTLVLLDDDVRGGGRLLGALSRIGEVRRFELPRPEALPRWITERARRRGCAITPRAAALLAESVGANLWQLHNEIEKLALYAHGRPIDVADVEALVTPVQGTVYQLIDAVIARQTAKALRLARQLLESGTAVQAVLALLARQFRQALLARDLRRRGASPEEILKALELQQQYHLDRVLALAGRLSDDWLTWAYERLLAADLAIKRGQLSDGVALDVLIAELGAARASAA
jgi:DNA polymerase-3 subunit delta